VVDEWIRLDDGCVPLDAAALAQQWNLHPLGEEE